jgi:sugar phosphate isomerase/epimerase
MSTRITRRDVLRGSLAALAATPLMTSSVLSAAEGAAVKRQPFKLAINVEPPKFDPAGIAPGWDATEIPISLVIKPFSTADEWKQTKAQIKAWKLPQFTASGYFAETIRPLLGPEADFEKQERWAKIAFARLAELDVGVAGVYGSHFAVPEGFSKEKATEQALKFCGMLAKHARPHKILIALEPTADPASLFPMYLDGLAFAKRVGEPEIRCMADLNYFIKANQSLEDIAKAPDYCLHVHIANKGAQPNEGERTATFLKLFGVLRDMGYTRSVCAACPWVNTLGGEFNHGAETAKTLNFLQGLRAKTYSA